MNESEKVLMVDDEPNILEGYARGLRREVTLDTAISGTEGLKAVEQKGPYAVIISDFKMPNMNGVEFLAEVKPKAPDTVRMMLTGYADLQTAIEAVNKGHIFRLLTKPCKTEDLLEAIRAGLEQYRLVNAEKVLLEKTLSGSIKVMTEILSLSNPAAFSRATIIKRYVHHMAAHLNLSHVWEFDLAAQLSQLGCVTFPQPLLAKVYTGERLSNEEGKLYAEYPKISGSLIENIPRLERIAGMIKAHQQPFKRRSEEDDLENEDRIALGGYLLKVALEFDRLFAGNVSVQTIISQLRHKLDYILPGVLEALENLEIIGERKIVKSIRMPELDRSMIFDEDVYTTDKVLLVSKGQEATFPLIRRLTNYDRGIGVMQPFRMIVLSST